MHEQTTGPKYLALSRILEKEVLAGRWSEGRAPSLRTIALSHAVSIITASRALQVLRNKGLVETVGRSGSYVRNELVRERWAGHFRVTPGAWIKPGMDLFRHAFESVLREGAEKARAVSRPFLAEIRERVGIRPLAR